MPGRDRATGRSKTPQEANAAIAAYKDEIRRLEETAYDFAMKHSKAMAAPATRWWPTSVKRTLAVMFVIMAAALGRSSVVAAW